MPRPPVDPAIAAAVSAATAARAAPPDRAQIEEVVTAILATLEGDISAGRLKLQADLADLAAVIVDARRELAALRPDDIRHLHIPAATDELDAIVGATEAATGDILDACERIEAAAGSLPAEQAGLVTDQVTRIYEACSFQDVTGQRVGKVVRTLKQIEARIGQMVEALGSAVAEVPLPPPPPLDMPRRADAHLLEGPQLPGGGMDQDAIDRLLAGLD